MTIKPRTKDKPASKRLTEKMKDDEDNEGARNGIELNVAVEADARYASLSARNNRRMLYKLVTVHFF